MKYQITKMYEHDTDNSQIYGIKAFFKTADGKQYVTDLSNVINYTECTIAPMVDGEPDWGTECYCERYIPVTMVQLITCIQKFCKSLK